MPWMTSLTQATPDMKPYFYILPILFVLGASNAAAQKGAAAREVAEFVLKKFGKEAAGESVETMTKKVVQISTRYGDDGVTAIRKVGPRAFDVIADAGEHSVGVVKLMARHGDEAVWVVAKPKGMAIFVKYGDEGAEAVMKHKGIATPLIEQTGESGVKALNAVGPAQGRHLVNLVDDGVIVPGQQSGKLLDVVGRYGDKAADFIWKNKGALVVGAALAAFIDNPEPFIDGAMSLPTAAISDIAPHVNWTLVFIAIFIVGVIALGVYLLFTGKVKRPQPNPSDSTPES